MRDTTPDTAPEPTLRGEALSAQRLERRRLGREERRRVLRVRGVAVDLEEQAGEAVEGEA